MLMKKVRYRQYKKQKLKGGGGWGLVLNEVGELTSARATFGRGKSASVNKYQDRVYVHLFGRPGKSVSLGFDEFEKLVALRQDIQYSFSDSTKKIYKRLIRD